MSEPLTPEQKDEALDIVAGVVAWQFHDTYERLAPDYGYETRPESAVPWKDVPAANRALMTATVKSILGDVFADRDSLRARIVELEGERERLQERWEKAGWLAEQDASALAAAEAKVLALEGVVSAARGAHSALLHLKACRCSSWNGDTPCVLGAALAAYDAAALPQDKEGEAER